MRTEPEIEAERKRLIDQLATTTFQSAAWVWLRQRIGTLDWVLNAGPQTLVLSQEAISLWDSVG